MDKYRNLYLQAPNDPPGDPPADPPKDPTPPADPPKDPPKDPTPPADPPKDPPKDPTPPADPPKDPPKATDPDVIKAELKAAAAMAGIPEAKIPHVIKMAEVSGADQPGADISAIAKAAVGKVLADVPELAGSGTGSLGDFRRGLNANEETKARQEFSKYL